VKDIVHSRELNTVEDLKQRMISSLATFLLRKETALIRVVQFKYSHKFKVVRDSCGHSALFLCNRPIGWRNVA
jgi:hypothetical protein